MKKISILLLLFVFSFASTLCAQATYVVTESGDTINITDETGSKQGFWDTKERNVRSRGEYVDGQMEGSWLFYHPRG
ncbi:MAG: hypothetical protein KAJ50_04860, partial [Bacteroidales bacterium]|nr:hypothetical protein [Bacteroidales bacterium]